MFNLLVTSSLKNRLFVLAAALVCGEQHRLSEEAVAAEHGTVKAIRTATKEVDVTN